MSDTSDPMDGSPPGFSVHGIFQAKVLEWGAIAFSASHLLDLVRWPEPVVKDSEKVAFYFTKRDAWLKIYCLTFLSQISFPWILGSQGKNV